MIVAKDNAQVEEAVTRLARVGMEHVQGYLDGGMYAWHQAGLPVATIAQIPVDELHHQLKEGQDVQVVDVRQPGEYCQRPRAGGHQPPPRAPGRGCRAIAPRTPRTLKVTANDPAFSADVRAWVTKMGHELLSLEAGGVQRAVIRKV